MENENTDTYDPENVSYLFGYNYFLSSDFVFRGIINYTKSEKISELVEPYTRIDIGSIISLINTYVIGYEYTNYKYGDLKESSDNYRITEQHINWLMFGISYDI